MSTPYPVIDSLRMTPSGLVPIEPALIVEEPADEDDDSSGQVGPINRYPYTRRLHHSDDVSVEEET